MFLLSLIATLPGCSSSDESGVYSGNVGQANLIVGRVQIDKPIAGAKVVAKGPQGENLTPAGVVTDQNGFFFLDKPLPNGSRVSVDAGTVFQGTSERLTLEVLISSDSPSQTITINYPLHLVGLLLQRHPSLTYMQAVAEVKRLLEIPDPWELWTLEENESSPFHHGQFLKQAAAVGGISQMSSQLLDLSDQKGTRRFSLTAGVAGDAETSILSSIVTNLSNGAVSFVGGDIAGWVVRFLGSLLGSAPDPFSGIDGQFLNLQNELASLAEEFKTEQVYINLQTQTITPISAATVDLQNAANSFVTPNPPLSLYSLGGGAAFLQALQTANYEQALTFLFSTLTGSDGLVTSYPNSPAVDLRPERTFARTTYPIVGIDSVLSQYNGYGAFSFHTTNPIEQIHKYYLDYATLGANLLAETAHSVVDGVGNDSASLAKACRTAQIQMLGTSGSPGLAARRKQVQQLLPPSLSLVSGQVFIDREYGLMWFTQAAGGLTLDQANSVAASLKVGPYSGWRLPYLFELDQLYSRIDGGWLNRTAQQRTGKKSSVLTDLGFDLSQMSSTHHVWGLQYEFAYLRPIRYSLDTAATSNFYANGRHDVLFVRSYVDANSSYVYTEPELSPVSGAPLEVHAQVNPGGATQLTATMDFACPIGGQFTINGKTINPMYGGTSTGLLPRPISGVAAGSERPGKDITSRVVWTSSNDAMAMVSNLEGEEGKVYWRTPAVAGAQNCTFTASFQGTTGSVTLERPTDMVWVVDSIYLTPNLSAVSFATNPTQEVVFVATVFMRNPATGDRTAFRSSIVGGEAAAPPVTWSVEKLDGMPIPSAFPNPQQSNLVIRDTDTTDSSVIVKATAGGVTAQTTLYLLRP